MKKIMILLLIIMFILSMTLIVSGCKKNAVVETTAAETTAAPATTAAETTASAVTTAAENTAAQAQLDMPKGEGLIYYLVPTLIDEWQSVAVKLLTKRAVELGYEMKTISADSNASTQIDQMDDAINLKPKFIFLGAVDAPTIGNSIKKAMDAGVPVLNFDRLVPDSKVFYTSAMDTLKLGVMGAEETVKLLKEKYGEEKGVILEVMGDPGDMFAVNVHEGFMQIMSTYPNITVISKAANLWEPTAAANITDDQLTSRKDIDELFLHNDVWMSAIEPVLTSHGINKGDIIVVGVAGQPGGLIYVRNGWMKIDVDLALIQQADAMYLYLDEILAGEKIIPQKFEFEGIQVEVKDEAWGPTLYCPGSIITIDNVDDPKHWGNSVEKS